jgi:hypothetical protein
MMVIYRVDGKVKCELGLLVINLAETSSDDCILISGLTVPTKPGLKRRSSTYN